MIHDLWKKKLSKAWMQTQTRLSTQPRLFQEKAIQKGLFLLAQNPTPKDFKQRLAGQPLDSFLLYLSPLYRQSRRQFCLAGGKFLPALISSPRTLSSPSLLQMHFSYSPLEEEYFWCATDRFERKNTRNLLKLRSYLSNVFHEQNHRILLKLLPSAPDESAPLRRYLNFMESLVITLDIALGDDLGAELGSLFHICGVIYNPGTSLKTSIVQKRIYKNYLHAIAYSTYLNLEFFHPRDIQNITKALFPELGELACLAAKRSGQLDRKFVIKTNPFWQKRHQKWTRQSLYQPEKSALVLSADPFENWSHYLWTEKWLNQMGL